MKILSVCHPEADFADAFTYMGLCQLAEVVDFPPKLSYHGLVHRYPTPYMPNSFGSGAFWDRFHTWLGQPDGVTGPYDFMRPTPNNPRTLDQILDELPSFDLIVMSSPRCWVSATMFQLKKSGKKLPPAVMIDGEDNQFIRQDYIQEFKPVAYFKRELFNYPENLSCQVYPYPLSSYVSTSYPDLPDVPRDIDVVCIVGETHLSRRPVIEELKKLGNNIRVELSSGKVSPLDHLKLLKRAKIGVSIRGWGCDTVRYWEILGCGALLLADVTGQIIPNPFEHMKNAVFYESAADCLSKAKELLLAPERLASIADAGKNHCETYHTVTARAQYLLNKVSHEC